MPFPFRHVGRTVATSVSRPGPGGLRPVAYRTVAGPSPRDRVAESRSPIAAVRHAARRLGRIGALPAGQEAASGGGRRIRWSSRRVGSTSRPGSWRG